MTTFKFSPAPGMGLDTAVYLTVRRGTALTVFLIQHPLALLHRDVRAVFHEQARIELAKIDKNISKRRKQGK